MFVLIISCVRVRVRLVLIFLWIHSFASLLFSPLVFFYFFMYSIPDHLQPLATRVKEAVLAFKADGTIRSYLAGVKRWKL